MTQIKSNNTLCTRRANKRWESQLARGVPVLKPATELEKYPPPHFQCFCANERKGTKGRTQSATDKSGADNITK